MFIDLVFEKAFDQTVLNSIKNSLKPYSISNAEKIVDLVVKHTSYKNDVRKDDNFLETNPVPKPIRIKEYSH